MEVDAGMHEPFRNGRRVDDAAQKTGAIDTPGSQRDPDGPSARSESTEFGVFL